jgi:hypothetical protein
LWKFHLFFYKHYQNKFHPLILNSNKGNLHAQK